MKFSELEKNMQQKSQIKEKSTAKLTISQLENQFKAQREAEEKQHQQTADNIFRKMPMKNGIKVADNKEIVNNYKNSLDSKTTIPSVDYNQDVVKENQLKKEMEDAKKTYETTKNSDNRTFLEKTLDRIGGISDDSAKNDYEAKKKEYENFVSRKTEKNIQLNFGISGDDYIKLLKQKKNDADSDILKNYYDDKIKETRKKLYGETNIFKHIGNVVKTGYLQHEKSVNATGDFLFGKIANALGFKNNLFSLANKDSTQRLENAQREMHDGAKYLGDNNIFWSELGANGIAMVPDLILTLLTRGISKTATATQLGSKAIANANPTFLTNLQNDIIATSKSPVFYSSFVRELGNNYEENVENGAGDIKASLAAMAASAVSARIEMGGWQALPDELAETNGIWKKLYKWFLSNLEEGAEELNQGAMTNAINKVFYDYDKAIYSNTDQDAVINFQRMIKEFGSGVILSGVMGGVNLTFDGIVTANNDSGYKAIGKIVAKKTKVQDLIDYAKSAKNENIRNLARAVNSNNITDADTGRLYQYAVRDIKEKFDDVYTESDFDEVINEYFTGDISQTIEDIASSAFANKLLEMNIEPEQNEKYQSFIGNDDESLRATTNAVTQPIENYAPEKQNIIKSFLNSVDEKIKNLVERVKSGDKTFVRQKISDVSDRAAADIKQLLGIDVSDYTHNINSDSVRHILNRHGENGEYNSTMSNDDDIARIGWVLENYDTVELLTKDDKQVYSTGFLNNEGGLSKQIRYIKRIDGTYYVVEAAAENKYKKIWVQSAYLQKTKEDVTRTATASDNTSHDADAQSAFVSPSSDTNIPQNDTGVNNIISESGEDNTQNPVLQSCANTEKFFESGNVKEIALSNQNKKRHHTTKAEQDFIKEICNALGREVIFEHIKPIETGIIPDGYIDSNNVIHIGFTVTDPVTFVLKHELTHFGEGTEQYEKFINSVETSRLFKEWLIEAVGERVSDKTDLELLITAYGELVADSRNGDNTDWKAEMYADFVGDCLFNDNGSGLKALLESVDSKHRPAFIQYILDFLSYLKTKLSGNNELTFEMIREISSLEDVFRKMLQEANSNEQNRIKEKTFSFARVKDNSVIEQAENMEEQGANREEIWHTLNVIRDSAGEWIYEIADNEIQFFPEGDAINELPSELDEYYKLANLGRMTAEKRSRFDELRKKYGLAFFRKGKLQDFLKHDKLFEKYPRLKETNLEFKIISTPAHYNPATDTIVLNAERLLREKGLKGSDKRIDDIVREIEFEEDIVHEIEHALQEYEDRERGASPEFWNARLLRGERLPINPETNKEYTPREAYMATNGEYEARESANRKNMDEEERREVVPDLGWGKTISAKEPALVKNQRISQSLDFEYISAVENADIETAQRLTDEVANAMGYTERLYHQTGAEFTEFNTENQKAGKYDFELPTGTFLKPSNDDIGLSGKKQMELYAKFQNPLKFENREDAQKFWKDNIEGYAEKVDELKLINAEYREKVDNAEADVQQYINQWRTENPNASRKDIYNDTEFQKLYDKQQDIIDEWDKSESEISVKTKSLIDAFISESGYDGIILERDDDGKNRHTKSYIAFDSAQLKSAEAVTYDDSGNVIALSERFNEQKRDIRYSIPRNKVAITKDMTDLERYEVLKNRKLSVAQANEKVYGEIADNYPEILNIKLKETDAKKILNKIGTEFNVFKHYYNTDVEIEFEFGKNNLNESLHKQNGNYDIYAQMLSCFSDVISNAVGIEVHNRNKEGYKTDRTLKNVYVLCSAFDNGLDIIPVKLEIKEFMDKPNRLYVAVALEGIKRDRVKSMGVPNNRSHIRTSPVTISIRDLFSKINNKDKDFIKYIPDGFLTEEQISTKIENEGKKLRDTAHRVNDVERPKPNEGYALKNDISNNSISKLNDDVNKKFSIPNELRTSLRMYKEGRISYEEYQEVLDVLWNNALANIQDKDLVQRLQKELEDQKEITMNTAINSARYANQLKKRIKRQNEQLKEQNEEIKRYNEVVTPYGTVSFGWTIVNKMDKKCVLKRKINSFSLIRR